MDEGAAVHHVALNDRSIVGEQSTQLLRLAARQAADEHLGGLQDKASITPDYYGQSGGAASLTLTYSIHVFIFLYNFSLFFSFIEMEMDNCAPDRQCDQRWLLPRPYR